MKKSKEFLKAMVGLSLVGSIALVSSHSILAQDVTEESSSMEVGESVEETSTMDHAMMEHDNEGRLPGGIKIKREPTHKVGDDVILINGHMPGMEGAEAVIVAAFETTAYEITYMPTDGGEEVSNHRWIVHEEVAGAQDALYEVGDQVVVDAYHMPGMQGATATVDAVTTQTVYMIDYVDTETGELVINHKWVVEEEIQALESDETEEEVSESTPAEESSVEESSSDGSSDESSEDSSESESESESESTSEESSEESSSEESSVESEGDEA